MAIEEKPREIKNQGKRSKMPIMPRNNKKASGIAFSILGTPPNMKKQRRRKSEHPGVKSDVRAEEFERINPSLAPIKR